MTRFECTVSALCYTVIYEQYGSIDAHTAAIANRATRFVLAQYGRMPDYLRLAMYGLTLSFGWRNFWQQPPAKRSQQLQRWRASPWAVCRDFVRFYEGLVVYDDMTNT